MSETADPGIHVFDAAVALTALGDGRVRGRTTEPYENMVGPFGGITAATMLRAIEVHPDRLGDPLALTVNFAAPISYGEFEVGARPVRTNRNSQHWTLELSQEGTTTTTGTAVFGHHRDSWADAEAVMPDVPPPDRIAPSGMLTVRWTGSYDMRFVEGAVPGPDDGPTDSSVTTLWVRDDPARPLDFTALVALCDCFFPRSFLRLGRFMAAGTISMTVHVHATPDELAAQGTDHVLAQARASRFSRGYADQTAEIWGRDGTLLATTHQLVYFNDQWRPDGRR